MDMDIITHRRRYLALAREYVTLARPVLEGMRHHFWVREGLRLLNTVTTPAQQPHTTEQAGYALQDDAADENQEDGWEWIIGGTLIQIGECARIGGYTTVDMLERLQEALDTLKNYPH